MEEIRQKTNRDGTVWKMKTGERREANKQELDFAEWGATSGEQKAAG